MQDEAHVVVKNTVLIKSQSVDERNIAPLFYAILEEGGWGYQHLPHPTAMFSFRQPPHPISMLSFGERYPPKL